MRLPRLVRIRRPRIVVGPSLLLWAVIGAIAVVGTWWIANGPVGDFRSVSLSGYDGKDRAEIEALVEEAVRSGNMVNIPADDVRKAARQSPWIDDVAFRRGFPLKLEVVVLRARPVAIGVPNKGKSLLVSSRGLILGPAGKGKSLPRIRLGKHNPAVGERIPRKARPAWRFVRAAEDTDVYPRIRGLRLRDKHLVGHLVEGAEIRVGPAEELRAKALSLDLVYSALSPEDRRAAAYVDLTVPDRPAVGSPVAAADLVADAGSPAAGPESGDGGTVAAPTASADGSAPAAAPEVATAPQVDTGAAQAAPAPAPDPEPSTAAAEPAPAPVPAPEPPPGPISPALDGASAPPPPQPEG